QVVSTRRHCLLSGRGINVMLEAKDIGLQNREKRQGLSIQWSRIGLYAAFILFTLVVLIPVYWMVRSSFATSPDLHTTPINYFPPFTFKNFTTLVEQVPFFHYIFNSFTFAVATTLLTLIASFLAAY